MQLIYRFKRGDTFFMAGRARLPAGTWGARAQLRQPLLDADFVVDLDVDLIAQVVANADPALPPWTHALALGKSAADSASWPIDGLEGDIEFFDPTGVVLSTRTFEVRVMKDVTHG